ncbi:hypothetical protein niasHS_016637 [Heterodera schachtii]|uniref:Uncharacterized protein n=1 Tax=Heterodera schachtii TaxID=97005 RepID=A0ABD2HVU9_HETSC
MHEQQRAEENRPRTRVRQCTRTAHAFRLSLPLHEAVHAHYTCALSSHVHAYSQPASQPAGWSRTRDRQMHYICSARVPPLVAPAQVGTRAPHMRTQRPRARVQPAASFSQRHASHAHAPLVRWVSTRSSLGALYRPFRGMAVPASRKEGN